ncbi:MAG TPA: hypothetical protein VGL66_05105 [Caulobacteraceae bacterium]
MFRRAPKPEPTEDPMEPYALWRAFAACVDGRVGLVGDTSTLPAKREDIEVALFLSFNGIQTRAQCESLKRLIVDLGSYVELSDEDRKSVSAFNTFNAACENANEKTKVALLKLMGPPIGRYADVLARVSASTDEMIFKVEAFSTQFKLAERFDA